MAMTVGQLRAALEGQPDDRLVVLQKDAEGNGYSPLAEADEAMYLAETTWSGEAFFTPEQIAEDDQAGEDDAAPDDAVRVILLGPVN